MSVEGFYLLVIVWCLKLSWVFFLCNDMDKKIIGKVKSVVLARHQTVSTGEGPAWKFRSLEEYSVYP